MLGCVGRGGNAQAVRDEILNIMHRNNIPEKNGTWMEQWHQKLVRAQWLVLIMHSLHFWATSACCTRLLELRGLICIRKPSTHLPNGGLQQGMPCSQHTRMCSAAGGSLDRRSQ